MTRTEIEWADHTWNPVTGCYHTCEYCYARRMSKRFSGDVRLNLTDERIIHQHSDGQLPLYLIKEPFISRNNRSLAYPAGFSATFHEYRLGWPLNVKNGANIFVGSMCDLFGEWVPDEWIERVFEACAAAPQHNYLFLTKNPKRYVELAEKGLIRTGENFWYGSSTPTPDTEFFWHESVNTFVSIEPIHQPFDFKIEKSVTKKVNWIIIGAETGNRKGKIVPKLEWINEIVTSADKNSVPVFMKDSLIPIVGEENMRRDYPENLRKKVLSPKLTKKLYHQCGICRQTFKKSDMFALLSREKRGESAKSIGYLCKNCFHDFKKGLQDNGD